MKGLDSKSRSADVATAQKHGRGIGLASPRTRQLAAMEDRANRRPQVRETAQLQEKLNAPNTTGMSDELKTGLESLSGMDLSGVNVHYNSPKPAQLQAHAYTQGQDIHVAPGQEQHVPHEGWHVVQQMQGRVQPTTQLAGTDINDSPALETEADVMGARASRESARATAQRRAVATGSTVQRKINLDDFLTDEDRQRLFASGLDVDDLEDVQDLLGDEEAVAGLLSELEGETEEQFWKKGNELKYTKALGAALYNQEAKWMNVNPEEKDLERIPGDSGVESNDKFLSHIATVKPLKDVGAAVSHGEYAHRLQWYIISRSMENNFKDMYGEDFLEQDGRPSREFRDLLQTLYRQMSDPEYTKMFEKGQIGPTDEHTRNNPDREKGQFPLPLWSALLDMPGSYVDNAKKGQKEYQMFGDIFAAAPVKLTGGLTFTSGTQKGSLQEGPLAYSQVSLAVLNRRLKRYLGGGSDLALKAQLNNLAKTDGEVQSLLKKASEESLDYDDRNELAFKLLGIL